jgi:heat-inducible transcriptional repressor
VLISHFIRDKSLDKLEIGFLDKFVSTMEDLTRRQITILKTIIEEYINSSHPVGSQKIEKKYELRVSPATIRNEMAKLTELGYLKQPHTSAGRVPTKKAFKLYVNELMEEKKLSVAEEVAAKEKVWDARFSFDQLLKEATRALADQVKALAVATTNEGEIFHSGYAYLLEEPEFYDIDLTRTVLEMLDHSQSLLDLFNKVYGEGPVHLLFGEDTGMELMEPCGMVFTRFEAGPGKSGSLGIIGPCRLSYPRVIPVVRHFGALVEELAKGL